MRLAHRLLPGKPVPDARERVGPRDATLVVHYADRAAMRSSSRRRRSAPSTCSRAASGRTQTIATGSSTTANAASSATGARSPSTRASPGQRADELRRLGTAADDVPTSRPPPSRRPAGRRTPGRKRAAPPRRAHPVPGAPRRAWARRCAMTSRARRRIRSPCRRDAQRARRCRPARDRTGYEQPAPHRVGRRTTSGREPAPSGPPSLVRPRTRPGTRPRSRRRRGPATHSEKGVDDGMKSAHAAAATRKDAASAYVTIALAPVAAPATTRSRDAATSAASARFRATAPRAEAGTD